MVTSRRTTDLRKANRTRFNATLGMLYPKTVPQINYNVFEKVYIYKGVL